MKSAVLSLASLLLIFVMVTALFFSCRKSETPPDPNLTIVVKRELVVAALGAALNDSIGQFSVAITSPTGTITQTATGNTYVVSNLVAGTYTIVVSKSGYATGEAKTVSVVLPTDAKSSLKIQATIMLTKVAPPVAVSSAAGATIAVKENSEVTASPVVASVTVAPATVFTLADGTKPATVNITVTNVPIPTQVAPVTNVAGVNQVVLPGIVAEANAMPLKTVDLQPEGMTFDKPMIIDVYIGNLYPPTMPLSAKIASQAGLTMNYTRKDGTKEVIRPDHFSTDRNTVYYKITHFSQWKMQNEFLTMTLTGTSKSTLQTKSQPLCATLFAGSFEYTSRYKDGDAADPWGAWLLTGESADAVFTVTEPFNFAASANYYINATWQCTLETWQMVDNTPDPYWQQWHIRTFVIPQKGELPKATYVQCHNQGGN